MTATHDAGADVALTVNTAVIVPSAPRQSLGPDNEWLRISTEMPARFVATLTRRGPSTARLIMTRRPCSHGRVIGDEVTMMTSHIVASVTSPRGS